MRDYFHEQAMAEDEREAKLPAWARDKIKTLRRSAEEARAELRSLKEGSTPGSFWIKNLDDDRRFYLPATARLCFGNLDLRQCGHDAAELEITASDGAPVVKPWAANVILVSIKE